MSSRLGLLLLTLTVINPAYSADQQAEQQNAPQQVEDDSSEPALPPSLIDQRFKSEQSLLADPFGITQYRRNYVLAFSYIDNPNQIGSSESNQDSIDNVEAKYQISVKMPLYRTDSGDSALFFGFTAVSFWQVYSSEVSKPFRETNYEPEIFYNWNTSYKLLGYRFNAFQLGFNHQSNGQSELRSRSWNRLYASLLMSDADNFYALKLWYRIPEDNKLDPLQPTGDDNPDITDYLGHFELTYGTELGNFQMLAKLRNNLKTSHNKGSIELNLTYAISDRYDLILQYFNGYGDSLIDYNNYQQRIGLGVQLAFF
ncbi:phospholipase A [Neptunicella sp. SCSIO 80796]|uniref:phospholipase A n=1 Tax=Neptunicella plasticusilytica TaxID=3117012 RepID=UPI003A4D6D5A